MSFHKVIEKQNKFHSPLGFSNWLFSLHAITQLRRKKSNRSVSKCVIIIGEEDTFLSLSPGVWIKKTRFGQHFLAEVKKSLLSIWGRGSQLQLHPAHDKVKSAVAKLFATDLISSLWASLFISLERRKQWYVEP